MAIVLVTFTPSKRNLLTWLGVACICTYWFAWFVTRSQLAALGAYIDGAGSVVTGKKVYGLSVLVWPIFVSLVSWFSSVLVGDQSSLLRRSIYTLTSAFGLVYIPASLMAMAFGVHGFEGLLGFEGTNDVCTASCMAFWSCPVLILIVVWVGMLFPGSEPGT